jgi:hypothetical protein
VTEEPTNSAPGDADPKEIQQEELQSALAGRLLRSRPRWPAATMTGKMEKVRTRIATLSMRSLLDRHRLGCCGVI